MINKNLNTLETRKQAERPINSLGSWHQSVNDCMKQSLFGYATPYSVLDKGTG